MKLHSYTLILKELTDEQREILLLRKAGFSYLEIIDIIQNESIHLTSQKIKGLIKTTATFIHKKDSTLVPQHAEKLGLPVSDEERYNFELIEAFLAKLPVVSAPDSLRKRINDISKSE